MASTPQLPVSCLSSSGRQLGTPPSSDRAQQPPSTHSASQKHPCRMMGHSHFLELQMDLPGHPFQQMGHSHPLLPLATVGDVNKTGKFIQSWREYTGSWGSYKATYRRTNFSGPWVLMNTSTTRPSVRAKFPRDGAEAWAQGGVERRGPWMHKVDLRPSMALTTLPLHITFGVQAHAHTHNPTSVLASYLPQFNSAF